MRPNRSKQAKKRNRVGGLWQCVWRTWTQPCLTCAPSYIFLIAKGYISCLGWSGSVGWALSHKAKGLGLIPGHSTCPCCWPVPTWGACKRQPSVSLNQCFSHTSMFFSLSPSLTLSLRISKIFLRVHFLFLLKSFQGRFLSFAPLQSWQKQRNLYRKRFQYFP